jgi:ABC-type uncharacterized transport system permease subunit
MVVAGAGICVYALAKIKATLTVSDIVQALFFIFNGTVIIYSIWVLMVTTAFWFVRIDLFYSIASAIFISPLRRSFTTDDRSTPFFEAIFSTKAETS